MTDHRTSTEGYLGAHHSSSYPLGSAMRRGAEEREAAEEAFRESQINARREGINARNAAFTSEASSNSEFGFIEWAVTAACVFGFGALVTRGLDSLGHQEAQLTSRPPVVALPHNPSQQYQARHHHHLRRRPLHTTNVSPQP